MALTLSQLQQFLFPPKSSAVLANTQGNNLSPEFIKSLYGNLPASTAPQVANSQTLSPNQTTLQNLNPATITNFPGATTTRGTQIPLPTGTVGTGVQTTGGTTGTTGVGTSGEGTAGAGEPAPYPGFEPVSVPDYATLEEEAFQQLKPYYEQLLQESRGDLNRAKSILTEDYAKGTREARQEYAMEVSNQRDNLAGTVSTLGLDFLTEQEKKINDLNQRGMAVGEMLPGESRAPAGEVRLPTTPTEFSTAISPFDTSRLGRGGVELNRLMENQKLRQEAQQRAAEQTITRLGFNLNKFTSPVAGDIFAPGVDRSQLGSSELDYLRGTEKATREQQLNEQQLAEKQRQQAQESAGRTFDVAVSKIPTALTNKYLNQDQSNFINYGAGV